MLQVGREDEATPDPDGVPWELDGGGPADMEDECVADPVDDGGDLAEEILDFDQLQNQLYRFVLYFQVFHL